jgi:hypothetical protein
MISQTKRLHGQRLDKSLYQHYASEKDTCIMASPECHLPNCYLVGQLKGLSVLESRCATD